ncbi:diiron oxygenase [Planctomycetota bacterium]|nr:diiron oxygenase [Planctomycetota bacterium]
MAETPTIDVVFRQDLETLEALNRKSVDLAFEVDDLDWARPLDRTKMWSPTDIAPLTHLPSFDLLSDPAKLRYNQLFAMGICEQFTWFEQDLLVPVLKTLLRTQRNMPPLLREALHHFMEEEYRHSEMFWRMLEKSEPDWYQTRKFRLFNVSKTQDKLLHFLLDRPRFFLLWIWVVIFFEERTVDYCRRYHKLNKKEPDLLDANYVEVHYFHFRDEARHYQLDQHLLTWLYDTEPYWKRKMAASMFYRLMRSYTSPKRTSIRVMEVLGREFPEIQKEAVPKLTAELPMLRTSESFHRAAFSRAAVGKSMALFAEYPELDSIWDLFMTENKDGPA